MTEKHIILPSGKPFVIHMVPAEGIRKGPYSRRRHREKQSGAGWTREEWIELLEKYEKKCLKCGSLERIVPDHVIPLKRGGKHALENIQPLCWNCNTRKGLTIADYR